MLTHRSGRRYVPRIALVVLSATVLSACGAASSRAPIYANFEAGAFESALEALPENRDPLLNALDRGAIEQARGNLNASNRAFEEAEELFEQNYTKSISLEAATWTLTPTAVPYQGEEFERVLIHVMEALNYIELGELNEAVVECRALNTRLNAIEERRGQGPPSRYREDAFARYLSGLIHEMNGDPIAAWIDLRRAHRIYSENYRTAYGIPVPPQLADDLLRLASTLGRQAELASLEAEFGHGPPTVPPSYGEVVAIIAVGMAPRKVEDSLILLTGDDIPIKIAVPRFEVGRAPRPTISLQTASARFTAPAVLVEDIGLIAEQNLADRIDREYLRMASRVTAKYLAARTARKKAGHFWGFLTGALGAGMENADLRSWRTLPLEFRMARIFLPAGTYDLQIRSSIATEPTALGTIKVDAGKRVLRYTRLTRRRSDYN